MQTLMAQCSWKVKDANGKSLACVYGRETRADADIAYVLTLAEARRIAPNTSRSFTTTYLATNPEAHQ